jgi:hypothetical protein
MMTRWMAQQTALQAGAKAAGQRTAPAAPQPQPGRVRGTEESDSMLAPTVPGRPGRRGGR